MIYDDDDDTMRDARCAYIYDTSNTRSHHACMCIVWYRGQTLQLEPSNSSIYICIYRITEFARTNYNNKNSNVRNNIASKTARLLHVSACDVRT